MLFNTTPIQMEWFYDLEGEKTKLNWFLLETTFEYYDRIRDSNELAAYREQYGEQHIAQFCTYYSRRMKKSLLNCLSGKRKSVIHYREYISDFYPHHSNELNNILDEIAYDAWSHMLSACENCPQQCLFDYGSRCLIFDTYED